MPMGKKSNGKFTWVIKNFSSLESEIVYSDPFFIGGCRWLLVAYPKGNDFDYLPLYLVDFADHESLPCEWRRKTYFRITIINQASTKLSVRQETNHWFDGFPREWGFSSMIPLTELLAEDGGFLVNGELKIVAKVNVLNVIGGLDVSEESDDASEEGLDDDNDSDYDDDSSEEGLDNVLNVIGGLDVSGEAEKATKMLRKTKEIMDVNGFQILPSQEPFITSMEKQVGKNFVGVIQNFSFLNSEKCYSDPFVIRDFKWRLLGECDLVFLHLYLCVADCPPFPSEVVKVRLKIVNQLSEKQSILKDSEHCFDEQSPTWDCEIPLEILAEDDGFLVNGDLMIVAEVIGLSDEFEESIPLKKFEVNGFHVLPSQVQSVRRIFERHPDTAVEFRAKNQHMRTTFMNFLLSLIETLYQPLQELSNEDLVEADIALSYLKDVGFKVDWLEKKLDQLKVRKEKERSCESRVQEMEAQLHDLNLKFETEKAELSATRAPLSFDDFV